MSTLDEQLVAGEFLWGEVDPDKSYLVHYLGNNEVEKVWLAYYCRFSGLIQEQSPYRFLSSFIDHTGLFASRPRQEKLLAMVQKLEEAKTKAEQTEDLQTLAALKLGQYKLA